MNNDNNNARSQALAQVESITEMVAALECDYDRLEELRDDLERVKADEDDANRDYGTSSTEATDARKDVDEWKADNADELAALESEAGDCTDREEAEQRIQEDALSVEVRAGWASPGELSTIGDEFRIVLCTGGPHVEIVGDLDEHSQPDRVRILYRDWGTSGELLDFDHEVVLAYCRQFYFGE